MRSKSRNSRAGRRARKAQAPREGVRKSDIASGDESPLRVAVATRPALIREILCRVLSSEPGLILAGHASDESGIRDLLRAEKPRVLLFDFEALGPSGESLISR